jgi:glucosamine kinase
MIFIADSGSTKTAWATVNNGKFLKAFHSDGFNPVTQSREQIMATLKGQVVPEFGKEMPTSIAFYGAGISNAERAGIIETCLREFFPHAQMEIAHDLLGAARAGYEGRTTIVAILGTGSNSCVYDGKVVVANVPSLGYILGDEGSGAHIGKRLVTDFIYGKMPEQIVRKFKTAYDLNKDIVIDRVYRMPDPNRWLASFTRFITDNIGEEYCRTVPIDSFRDFFENHISAYRQYQDSPFNAIGSVAFHFREQLKQVCEEFGFKFGKVIQSPIDGLIQYHIKQERV